MKRLILFLSFTILTSCQAINEGRVPTIPEAIDTVEFVCDVEKAISPEESTEKIEASVERICFLLEALNDSGILPSAPGPQHLADCKLLKETEAVSTQGYKTICDPAVISILQSVEAYEIALAGEYSGYVPTKPTIVFDSPRTDSKNCGEQSITAISICGDEIYVRLSQLKNYSDPVYAAQYTMCHEVGHSSQTQNVSNPDEGSLLLDYRQNQSFRETQGDCVCGALNVLVAEPFGGYLVEELSRDITLMKNIGNLPTHGTIEQRITYYKYGVENGVKACLEIKPSEPLI